MPPRTPGDQPGASVRRTAGQQAGKPRTIVGEYVVKPHAHLGGLLGIYWSETGRNDGAPLVTLNEHRVPLLAVAVDRYLARHTPVVMLADAVAQARAALAGDSANARADALRDITAAMAAMLGAAVDGAVADAAAIPRQGGGAR